MTDFTEIRAAFAQKMTSFCRKHLGEFANVRNSELSNLERFEVIKGNECETIAALTPDEFQCQMIGKTKTIKRFLETFNCQLMLI